MKLGAKQELFASLLPRLITYAIKQGYGVRPKELLRPKEMADIYAARGSGIKNSLHCKGLALDLVLAKGGIPLWDKESYRKVGDYWQSLNPLCCWGGNFRRRDAFHFSVTHGGVK
jgi:hypothetical protein